MYLNFYHQDVQHRAHNAVLNYTKTRSSPPSDKSKNILLS